MSPSDTMPFAGILQELRDARFTKGFVCPLCGSTSVKRNGKVEGRQRYYCKTCCKTFGDTSSSVLSGTHYPEKWVQYFEFMVQGLSLRKIAKALEIHVSTAFYWRHKILLALSTKLNNPLTGIIEADETYFLESLKGKNCVKRLGDRKARKRGGVAKKRGISCEQVCVLVATDRNGEIISRVAGKGRTTNEQIDDVLGHHLKNIACLCTDSATNFVAYAKGKGFEHQILNANKGERVKKGIYHIQHVNNYHKRLKDWMARFGGVATKYLDHYLTWFRFLEQHKSISNRAKKQDMLIQSFTNSWHIKTQFLRSI
jgi:transposase-like protein